METATFIAIFFSCLLISFTGYALYTAFGTPSKELRDPFEEHEDWYKNTTLIQGKINA